MYCLPQENKTWVYVIGYIIKQYQRNICRSNKCVHCTKFFRIKIGNIIEYHHSFPFIWEITKSKTIKWLYLLPHAKMKCNRAILRAIIYLYFENIYHSQFWSLNCWLQYYFICDVQQAYRFRGPYWNIHRVAILFHYRLLSTPYTVLAPVILVLMSSMNCK